MVKLCSYTELETADRCFPASRVASNRRYVWTRSLGFNGDVWIWNSNQMGWTPKKNALEKRTNVGCHCLTQSGVMITHHW